VCAAHGVRNVIAVHQALLANLTKLAHRKTLLQVNLTANHEGNNLPIMNQTMIQTKI
jgi:hypothetical protein